MTADKELERRGHRFARYADDFLVMVKSAKATERVMASLTRFVEGRLKWKQPRTRRGHLLSLGIPREEGKRLTSRIFSLSVRSLILAA